MREPTPWEKLDGVKHTLDLVLESAVTWERERILGLRKQIINCVINYGLTPEAYERVMRDLEELIKGEQK